MLPQTVFLFALVGLAFAGTTLMAPVQKEIASVAPVAPVTNALRPKRHLLGGAALLGGGALLGGAALLGG